MRFGILGSLQVHAASGWVSIRAAQQRIVLAMLIAEPGQSITTDRLAEAVWSGQPPRAVTNTLAAYVLRLRRLLEDPHGAVLVTRDRGYQLVVGDDDLDSAAFEQAVTAGRKQLEGREIEDARETLAQALSLWRGPVLADVPPTPALTSLVSYLEQMRRRTEEDYAGALLDLGKHAEAAEKLYQLVEREPLREQRWALLMNALHQL